MDSGDQAGLVLPEEKHRNRLNSRTYGKDTAVVPHGGGDDKGPILARRHVLQATEGERVDRPQAMAEENNNNQDDIHKMAEDERMEDSFHMRHSTVAAEGASRNSKLDVEGM